MSAHSASPRPSSAVPFSVEQLAALQAGDTAYRTDSGRILVLQAPQAPGAPFDNLLAGAPIPAGLHQMDEAELSASFEATASLFPGDRARDAFQSIGRVRQALEDIQPFKASQGQGQPGAPVKARGAHIGEGIARGMLQFLKSLTSQSRAEVDSKAMGIQADHLSRGTRFAAIGVDNALSKAGLVPARMPAIQREGLIEQAISMAQSLHEARLAPKRQGPALGDFSKAGEHVVAGFLEKSRLQGQDGLTLLE